MEKSTERQVLIFLLIILLAGIGDLFVSESPREFYSSHLLGQVLVCAYSIYQHSQILILCTIPSRLPLTASHTYSHIPFVRVCCIHLYD